MKKKYRIGTAFKHTYSKIKQNITKKTKKIATICALKKTGTCIKKKINKLIKKSENSLKRMTRKANISVAKKISSITKDHL